MWTNPVVTGQPEHYYKIKTGVRNRVSKYYTAKQPRYFNRQQRLTSRTVSIVLAGQVLPSAVQVVREIGAAQKRGFEVYCGAISAPVQRVAAPLMIEIERRGDVCLLRFRGDFRTGEDPDYLRAKMDKIVALDCAKVLADFGDVRTVGATGLSFLVGLYRTSGGHFVLAGIQPRVREVLEITRLNTVIRLAEDVEQGLAALRSGD